MHVFENQCFMNLPKLQKIFRNNGQNLGKKVKGLLPKMVKKKTRNNYAAGAPLGKQLGGAMNE